MKFCLIKEVSNKHTILTKCGRTTTSADATAWASDVTCPRCLDGTMQPDELVEALESLAAQP